MNKSLLSLTLITGLLIAGCGETPDDSLSRNCEIERTPVERFSLCLPTGWMVVTEEFGDQGNFVARIVDDGVMGIVMQMHVRKDPLQEPVSNHMAFAQRAVEIARETAPNYSPVSTDPISVNGEETLLHIFDATPEEDGETVRYYQIVTIHNGIAYGITGVMLVDDNEQLKDVLKDILTNLRFS